MTSDVIGDVVLDCQEMHAMKSHCSCVRLME